MAEATALPKGLTAKLVDALLDAIAHGLKTGSEVRLAGFGVFDTQIRKPSSARNRRTGEVMAIPQSTRVRFRIAKGLKDAVQSVPGGG